MTADGSAKSVLVVCNDADYFMRHRLPVVLHLVASGAQVTVITGGEPIAEQRIEGWSYLHTPIERFAFAPVSDLLLFVKTLRHVRVLKPDAIHLITLKPAVFSGLAAIAARPFYGRPARILITIPGQGRMMSGVGTEGRPGVALARRITEAVVRFLARRKGVHFTFETAHDRDAWVSRRLILEATSSVIEGAGVDSGKFFPASKRPHGRIRVLFAARLLRSKGLDTFLAVAKRLAGRPDVEFLVAGIGSNGDPDGIGSSLLEQESAIRFLGKVDDMPTLLRGCDIVCLPTRYGEGIPRILIEAAATGLASIASDIPGCRQIVVDGKTGHLVPVARDMASAVADALLNYLVQPALVRAHGDAAYEFFSSGNFHEGRIAVRFLELLHV